jgi:hypothetical protein
MIRMKKIGAFFAAGLLLVAWRSREKTGAIGLQAATRKSYRNTMDTGRDRWKTGNRAFKGDACIFGSGKSFGQRVV